MDGYCIYYGPHLRFYRSGFLNWDELKLCNLSCGTLLNAYVKFSTFRRMLGPITSLFCLSRWFASFFFILFSLDNAQYIFHVKLHIRIPSDNNKLFLLLLNVKGLAGGAMLVNCVHSYYKMLQWSNMILSILSYVVACSFGDNYYYHSKIYFTTIMIVHLLQNRQVVIAQELIPSCREHRQLISERCYLFVFVPVNIFNLFYFSFQLEALLVCMLFWAT